MSKQNEDPTGPEREAFVLWIEQREDGRCVGVLERTRDSARRPFESAAELLEMLAPAARMSSSSRPTQAGTPPGRPG